MQMNSTALYAGISWLRQRNNWNSFSSFSQISIQLWNHIHSISKQTHDRKKTFMNIWASYTEKQHQSWNWIKGSLLLIPICTWVFFTSSLLALLLLNASIMLQCTKEGAYISFSLSNSTTIKSTINSYLTALNLLNVFLSTKDESLKAQGPFTIQVRFFMNAFIKEQRNNFEVFQNL